jgi:hypothetical protein
MNNKIMKKFLLAIVISISMSSCYTMIHVSGTGASKSIVVKKKQWYALWGLVKINHVDPKTMAGGVTNYTVKTEFRFKDNLLNFLIFVSSCQAETVTIIK